MPLSEHEQRQLEQIEQALYAEHPRFIKTVRSADPKVHYKRRITYAAVGFVIGLALLPVGISIQQIWVSVAGFVVMLSCSYWAALSYRRMTGIATGRVTIKERRPRGRGRRAGRTAAGTPASQDGPRSRRGRKRRGTGFGERLEERWRRRQEDRGN